jgi:hypothetical protein
VRLSKQYLISYNFSLSSETYPEIDRKYKLRWVAILKSSIERVRSRHFIVIIIFAPSDNFIAMEHKMSESPVKSPFPKTALYSHSTSGEKHLFSTSLKQINRPPSNTYLLNIHQMSAKI